MENSRDNDLSPKEERMIENFVCIGLGTFAGYTSGAMLMRLLEWIFG